MIKDKAGNVIGIHVTVSIKKNKLAAPFKKCEFDIHFGKGIVEYEFIFARCRSHCDNNVVTLEQEVSGVVKKLAIKISGNGSWKELMVTDATTNDVILEKKFYKGEFGDLMKDPTYKVFIDKVIDDAYVSKGDTVAAEEGEVTADEDEVVDD